MDHHSNVKALGGCEAGAGILLSVTDPEIQVNWNKLDANPK